ncbi:NAD(P)H-dependent oxidoreductase [Nocardia sp. NPDC060249]|uniref:NAD(P)H-dependent oxidoreductase n=1 Tax=Nocardia sp. NPDC060249 TaxID=3347082 RepID=UPI00366416EF
MEYRHYVRGAAAPEQRRTDRAPVYGHLSGVSPHRTGHRGRSSSRGEASVSHQVALSFRDHWQGPVVHRDLASTPVPHLDAAGITARDADRPRHTSEQAKTAAVQAELIEEFLGAGGYLFTVPMYNLSMPSVVQGVAGPDHRALPHPQPHRRFPGRGPHGRADHGSWRQLRPRNPQYGLDFVVSKLEAVLGSGILGLNVTAVIPELIMAPHAAALAPLLPLHKASLAAAHEQDRDLATTLGPHPCGLTAPFRS